MCSNLYWNRGLLEQAGRQYVKHSCISVIPYETEHETTAEVDHDFFL